jgi:ankyrin repeat protein
MELLARLPDAAAQGRTAQVQDLVAHGAALQTKDKDGRTPLVVAAQRGYSGTPSPGIGPACVLAMFSLRAVATATSRS